jgi:hypothetical protein
MSFLLRRVTAYSGPMIAAPDGEKGRLLTGVRLLAF